MKNQPFVVTPDAYDRPLNVVGEKITVLASNALTQGYEIFLQQGDEGTGPPPHSHDWDESFYVTKGNVAIRFDDQTVTATPGTLVHLPARTVHSFQFGPGGGEMISVTSHNGQAANLFKTIDQEIPAGLPDVPKLITVAERCGVAIAV
ncbi:cupin domain-containing protein [Noviherbaspirillum galbum]|uniref:Cupin domain-containing protein n=1 Tax=Noviherbaspirillum galbum TaxID=2709383 RepID=A0A6B3SWZ5_9BURK|nr:cupin domain-containing protein [Noviherbaspirillum galbum]NEX62962.1 cupin domain-containing protein [Noviherbaspirillum galbum]